MPAPGADGPQRGLGLLLELALIRRGRCDAPWGTENRTEAGRLRTVEGRRGQSPGARKGGEHGERSGPLGCLRRRARGGGARRGGERAQPELGGQAVGRYAPARLEG